MLIYGFLVRDNIEALVSIVTISKNYVVLEAKHVCFGLSATTMETGCRRVSNYFEQLKSCLPIAFLGSYKDGAFR